MTANNVCIVTGSATGIGAACVIELARRGWRTVINYTKSEAEAQETARECEKPRMQIAVAWRMPRWKSGAASTA